MKRIAVVPTLCTLGNAACGFSAIVFAAGVNRAADLSPAIAAYVSGWLILAAMIFDAFDGYIARRTRTVSQFGAELDSLCDAISFGAAPAFLLIQLGSAFPGRLVKESFLVIAVLYMVCAVLRLARFNAQMLDTRSHRFFKGLPSPAAAGCIASMVVLRYNPFESRLVPDALVNQVIPWVAPLVALTVALLMVSRVPYLHFANRVLHRRHNFNRLVQVVLAAFAVVLLGELAIVLAFWAYALYGPGLLLWHRAQGREPAVVRAERSPTEPRP